MEQIPQVVLQKIISQIILQNFCKIGLNRKELEVLEEALVVRFFFLKTNIFFVKN